MKNIVTERQRMELNAKTKPMKHIILFFLFLVCQISFGQRYISLDNLTEKHNVKRYTLSLKTYGIDREFEIYNVFRGDQLIVFSILPDLDSDSDWQKIEYKNYSGQNMISLYKLISELAQQGNTGVGHYLLVKSTNEGSFVAKTTRIDVFTIVDFPAEFQFSENNILNLGQKCILPQELKQVFKDKYPNEVFPSDEMSSGMIYFPTYLESVYLSDIQEVNNEKMYYFWNYNVDYKPEKFVYMQDRGIVAITYNYYFSFPTRGKIVPYDKKSKRYKLKKIWSENYSEEKIMWAKELFPEKQ